jgi:DNA-directed RNA polymerase subunit omega
VRNDYLKKAQTIIKDPNLLVNVVSKRIVQLREGHKPLIQSYEKLDMEDIALREIIEGKIQYRFAEEHTAGAEAIQSFAAEKD